MCSSDLYALILSKFVYGTRVLTVVTFGVNKPIKTSKFFLINTICLMIIASVILLIGWFFGGLLNLNLFYRNFKLFFLGLLLLIVFVVISKKWIQKKSVQLCLPTKRKRE